MPKRDKKAKNATVSSLFRGDLEFSQVGRRFGTGLAMVTNSVSIDNASDLLLSSQVGTVLDKIEKAYQPDLMIFDLPPVLVNDDTIAFSQHVDCVLVVAAAEESTVAEIDKCERELAAQTNVLGVILNKYRLQPPDGRYGYNYAYNY
jgi:Mrp family chromosome partitioning ATPase